MIIKSHVRGGFRAAAHYLMETGRNETVRLVALSDPDAANLVEAFRHMWVVASSSKVRKPLHHISISPFRDERLTDDQVKKIVERAGRKYGYKPGDHQHVIVEHVLDGRQHFHVMWNRVSLTTNRAVWPGEHWKKSKQAAREMEEELGLKRPVSRRATPKSPESPVPDSLSAPREWKPAIVTWHVPHRPPHRSAPVLPLVHRQIAGNVTRVHPQGLVQPGALSASVTKGWPAAAILDWETWGQRAPVRFFRLWSELCPPSFTLG